MAKRHANDDVFEKKIQLIERAFSPSTAAKERDKMNRVSLAPMMKFSDPHFRHLMRLIHPTVILYSEMIVDKMVIHIDDTKLDKYIGPYDPNTVIQVAGNNPEEFLQASRRIASRGFKEINFNSGCPSHKVQNARIGAILMQTPELVAEIISKAKGALPGITFTVKCRIGIDNEESYEFFKHYVDVIAERNPGMHFIVHARKAMLKGLTTKGNRNIPPLKYEYVYRISRERPDLRFTINGGIRTVSDVLHHLGSFSGDVMIGRGIYENPLLLHALSKAIEQPPIDSSLLCLSESELRKALIQEYCNYAEEFLEKPRKNINKLIHPLTDLYFGNALANYYRKLVHQYFLVSPNPYEHLTLAQRMEDILSTLTRMKETLI